MTTYSFCTAPLLALSFLPKPVSPVKNVRQSSTSKALPLRGAGGDVASTERVLGALYRLAREAEPATLQRLALVIGLADSSALVAPLARLAKDGLIQKRGGAIGLSLLGFAAAAALSTPRNPRRQA